MGVGEPRALLDLLYGAHDFAPLERPASARRRRRSCPGHGFDDSSPRATAARWRSLEPGRRKTRWRPTAAPDVGRAAVIVDVCLADATGFPVRSTATIATSNGTGAPSVRAKSPASTFTRTTAAAVSALTKGVTASVSVLEPRLAAGVLEGRRNGPAGLPNHAAGAERKTTVADHP